MPRTQTEPLMGIFGLAQGLKIREEKLDGRDHLVVPMIALVEGVYQCANCEHPNFYPAAEFAKNVGAWNGRPVTISHPVRGGSLVSAGTPDVWQNERIGTVFNSRLDGDKLRCEAWLDPEMVERAGKEAQAVLKAIRNGEQVEVSTAAWVDELPRFGSYGGRKFEAVHTHFQPDHIAILRLGERGACDWQDGCGVRVASAKVEGRKVKDLGACCDACAIGKPCDCADHDHDDDGGDPVELQTGRALEYALQVALEQEYGHYCLVLDWDEQYVYFACEGRRGYRRRSYSESEDGTVTLGGEDDERVRPRPEYVVVGNAGDGDPAAEASEDDDSIHQEDGDMPETNKTAAPAEGQQPPVIPETPAAAAAPAAPAPAQQPAATAAAATQPLSNNDRQIAALQAQVEFLKDKLAQLERPAPQTPEEYIEAAPVQLRSTLMQLYKAQEKRRLELVDQIAAAPGCMWSKEELDRMEVDQLEKLAALAQRTDYGVRPAPDRILTGDADDFAPLPEMALDKPAANGRQPS